MARRVIINIDEDAWNECDIAEEIREVANRIDEGYTNGLTNFGNCWSIDEED